MNVDLPGRARTHVWLGLVVSLVGVAVGAYAYTGDRIYELEFLVVAVVGLALIVGGSTLAGVGQSNRPRMGGPPDEEEPSLLKRLRERVLGDGDAKADEEEDQAEAAPSQPLRVRVGCPTCEAAFEASGVPPFEATCPECGHEDEVPVPDEEAT